MLCVKLQTRGSEFDYKYNQALWTLWFSTAHHCFQWLSYPSVDSLDGISKHFDAVGWNGSIERTVNKDCKSEAWKPLQRQRSLKCICWHTFALGVTWPCLESDMSFILHDFAIRNERCSCRSVTVKCMRHASNAISVIFSAEQAGHWTHGYICFHFPTPLIYIITANDCLQEMLCSFLVLRNGGISISVRN